MNYLDDCPLCRKIIEATAQPGSVGEFCVKFNYQNKMTVTLKSHDTQLSQEAAKEAMTMLGQVKGLVQDLDIPGHWAMQVMPGSWSASGKSKLYKEKI